MNRIPNNTKPGYSYTKYSYIIESSLNICWNNKIGTRIKIYFKKEDTISFNKETLLYNSMEKT